MLLQEQRELVVEYGRRLVRSGLTVGTFGNLSVCDRERNLVAISPSGMDYFATAPEDVGVVDLRGEVVEGGRKPSSELDLHCLLYQSRPDVGAVVHTHSTYATVLACLRWPIDPIHYLVAYSGRDVPCIPYYPFGSLELAENRKPLYILLSLLACSGFSLLCALSHPAVALLPQSVYFPCLGAAFAALCCTVWFVIRQLRGE